jgi:predicted TIM-barrel fold metal-dependent hydrolase
MGERLAVITTDSHIGRPDVDLSDYFGERHRAAYQEQREIGINAAARMAGLGLTMKMNGMTFFEPNAVAAQQKLRRETLASVGIDEFDDDQIMSVVGDSDPDLRVKELEADGTVAAVLYPQGGAFLLGRPPDDDLYWDGIRASNRWMADFVSTAPNRHAGTFVADLEDVARTCDEARWAAEHDLRGGLFIGSFLVAGDTKPLNDLCYDPLWSTLEDLELPFVMHAAFGSGSLALGDAPGSLAITTLNLSHQYLQCGGPLSHLIYGEVFERHPRLRTVIAETGGIRWAIETKRILDEVYDDPTPGSIKAYDAIAADRGRSLHLLPRKPSEYFEDHVWVQLHCHAKDWRRIHDLGVENIVWGSDFPHAESSWPESMDDLAQQFADFGVSREDATTILRDNPANLFGFDVEALQPIADQCGRDFWGDADAARS